MACSYETLHVTRGEKRLEKAQPEAKTLYEKNGNAAEKLTGILWNGFECCLEQICFFKQQKLKSKNEMNSHLFSLMLLH